MVRLDDEVVGSSDILLHHRIRFAAVGNNHESLSVKINDITKALGGVVVDLYGIDSIVSEVPFLLFREVSSGGSQFLPNTVVAVDTLVYGSSSKDRHVHTFTNSSNRPNMVGMVVRDKNSEDIGEVEVHVLQMFEDSPCGYSRVDENTSRRGPEIVAIAATSTRQTSKNDLFFFHRLSKNRAKVRQIFHIRKCEVVFSQVSMPYTCPCLVFYIASFCLPGLFPMTIHRCSLFAHDRMSVAGRE